MQPNRESQSPVIDLSTNSVHYNQLPYPTEHGKENLTPNYPGQPLLYPGLPHGGFTNYSQSIDQVPPSAPSFYSAPYFQPQQLSQPQPQQQQHIQSAFHVVHSTVQHGQLESYGLYQALACVVLWCCNFLFGFIAWILALTADSTKLTDRDQARRLGRVSLGMSVGGIVVTVVIVAVVIGVIYRSNKLPKTSVGSSSSTTPCTYLISGTCYSTRRYVYNSCSSLYSRSYVSCCNSYEDAYYSYYCYTR